MASTLLSGVGSNLITVAIGALAGLGFLLFRRKSLVRFYGIRRSQDAIRIVVPRLDVKPGGTTAAIPVIRGYAGPAVTQIDYEAAVLLQEQIRPNTFSWLSKEVRDWVSGRLVLAAPVNPVIELAPAAADVASWQCSRASTSLILIGGPAYNAASGLYQDQKGAHFAFVRGDDGVRWCVKPLLGRTPGDPSLIESRAAGRELGFVQRIIREDTGAYITMCAGTGAGATLATAEWLSRHYRQENRRCRNREYGILLAFAATNDPHRRFSGGFDTTVLDRMVAGKRPLGGQCGIPGHLLLRPWRRRPPLPGSSWTSTAFCLPSSMTPPLADCRTGSPRLSPSWPARWDCSPSSRDDPLNSSGSAYQSLK
jgi:hypothetical protein